MYVIRQLKVKEGGRTIRYEIHKLIIYIGKTGMPEKWKESSIVELVRNLVAHGDAREGK